MTCRCDLGQMRGRACHCRTCCLTFTGPTAFDQHIVHGTHQEPSARGLVPVRPGVWGSARRNEWARRLEAS